jgi:hypothetical protein
MNMEPAYRRVWASENEPSVAFLTFVLFLPNSRFSLLLTGLPRDRSSSPEIESDSDFNADYKPALRPTQPPTKDCLCRDKAATA